MRLMIGTDCRQNSIRNDRVSAPTGKILALPIRWARSRIISATADVSMTGWVSGGQHSVVNPPATTATGLLTRLSRISEARTFRYPPAAPCMDRQALQTPPDNRAFQVRNPLGFASDLHATTRT
ncbi:MAG: hypothetical protein ACRER2_04040 [Methylococcales bacterium]